MLRGNFGNITHGILAAVTGGGMGKIIGGNNGKTGELHASQNSHASSTSSTSHGGPSPGFLPPRGDYHTLLSYQKAVVGRRPPRHQDAGTGVTAGVQTDGTRVDYGY